MNLEKTIMNLAAVRFVQLDSGRTEDLSAIEVIICNNVTRVFDIFINAEDCRLAVTSLFWKRGITIKFNGNMWCLNGVECETKFSTFEDAVGTACMIVEEIA